MIRCMCYIIVDNDDAFFSLTLSRSGFANWVQQKWMPPRQQITHGDFSTRDQVNFQRLHVAATGIIRCVMY